MGYELIRTWLQLPQGDWPPDHHTLLGLTADVTDGALIEQRVYERMEIVRRYQLIHPELATEAMNRLAQALISLTDSASKKLLQPAPAPKLLEPPPPSTVAVYEMPPKVEAPSVPLALPETVPLPSDAEVNAQVSETRSPLSLLLRDELQQREAARERAERQSEPAPDAADTDPESKAVTIVETPVTPALEPVVFLSEEAPFSRKGLGTRRALYQQMRWVRRLQQAWNEVGTFLATPNRVIQRPREAKEFQDQMEQIRELVRAVPHLLGEAGLPGYLVLTLSRQQPLVPTFQTLLPSQRFALGRDWEAGRIHIKKYKAFLLQEVRAYHGKNRISRAVRLLRTDWSEAQGVILLVLALIALDLSDESLLRTWWLQLLVLVGYAGARFYWWWRSLNPVIHELPSRRTPRAGTGAASPRKPRKQSQRA